MDDYVPDEDLEAMEDFMPEEEGESDTDDHDDLEFEKGMGLGAWMSETEHDPPLESKKGTEEPEVVSLKDRHKKSKKSPFERHVDFTIQKANEGDWSWLK